MGPDYGLLTLLLEDPRYERRAVKMWVDQERAGTDGQ